jgi:hypothetical protein
VSPREVTLKLNALLGRGVEVPGGFRWPCVACGEGRTDPLYKPLVMDDRGLRCDFCGASSREVLIVVMREFRLEHLRVELTQWQDRLETVEYLLADAERRAAEAEVRARALQLRVGELEGARHRNDAEMVL